MTASTSRRRVYTVDDVAKWRRALEDGIEGADFKARFSLELSVAREAARRIAGEELPPIVRVDASRVKVPGERSTVHMPTRGGRRRRML
jgi:hypothetical protein